MKRLIVMLGLGLCLAAPVFANTGVALVHGTGAQTDARNDYWTGSMVDSVAAGLSNSNRVLVVNCDFEQYMWDSAAAGCLADQLHGFITQHNLDDLVVITHSNGGNVMRWILSNPTWDARYPDIIEATRWVNALAPSSLGTPLANAVMEGNTFEQALGWLLGYKSDAVRMQQTHWMSHYNNQWLKGTDGRPSLPTGFWSVVGSDVRSAVWSGNAYCGGYGQSVGLEVTQNWLDSCSDGFLDCSSQSGAGTVWFQDTQVMDNGYVLNHNQSRRPCFGLDEVLRNDL